MDEYLICLECKAMFEEIDMDLGCCPECGSKHIDYCEDVIDELD